MYRVLPVLRYRSGSPSKRLQTAESPPPFDSLPDTGTLVPAAMLSSADRCESHSQIRTDTDTACPFSPAPVQQCGNRSNAKRPAVPHVRLHCGPTEPTRAPESAAALPAVASIYGKFRTARPQAAIHPLIPPIGPAPNAPKTSAAHPDGPPVPEHPSNARSPQPAGDLYFEMLAQ